MAELKPCPFCGGKAIIRYCENGDRYRSNIYYPSKRGAVICEKCRVETHVYSRASKAVNAWNRRVGEKDGNALS